MERDMYAPAQTSVWNWNTGQPSIMRGIQKEANISRKAVESQGTRFRHDPVPTLLKKPNRNGSGRTIPIRTRIDLQAVYEFRMSGKTWDEVAAKFGCSTKHIHEKMTDTYPELRKVYHLGKRPGNKPRDIDIAAVIRDILGGMSIRAVAPKYGVSHVSLGRKLKQTTSGAYAVEVAKARALDANVRLMEQAKQRRAA